MFQHRQFSSNCVPPFLTTPDLDVAELRLSSRPALWMLQEEQVRPRLGRPPGGDGRPGSSLLCPSPAFI